MSNTRQSISASDVQQPFFGWMKGMPSFPGRASSEGVADRKLNVLAEDIDLPCAVVKETILRRNEVWMAEFTRRAGVKICPHGKTTMSPELFSRQLANGAWGITAATPHQLRVMRELGIQRIIYANQLLGRSILRYVVEELNRDPGFEFYCLVDSVETVRVLGAAATPLDRPLKVLLEVGQQQGRTGVRTWADALEVAKSIADYPRLASAGVETYEFVVSGNSEEIRERNMRTLFDQFIATALELDRLGYFTAPEVVLSAGGSGAFDLAAAAITSVKLSRPVVPVIRSGCYLTHDENWLPSQLDLMRARSSLVADIPGRPAGAVEVWGYVQSRPDPTRALASFGKRDVSHDIALPRPTQWFRPGVHEKPAVFIDGTAIEALNDQHAYLRIPPESPLEVGDMISVGIAHPCTTFDKWRAMLVVDDSYNVIGALSTWF